MRRVLLLAAALAPACAPAPPSGDFVLRVGVVDPIGEVGPQSTAGGAALAGDLLFEPLATPRPGGATSKFLRRWERLGPRRWRLDLEPGRRFSDGSEVTAADVADAARAQGMAVVLASSQASLEVETRGAHPVEVDLAFAVLARRTAHGWVGTGAFAVEVEEPHRLVLRRVQPAPGRIGRVELVGCASQREAFARLLRGDLNAMTGLDRALGELLDGVPGLQVVRGTAPNAVVAWLSPNVPAEERRRIVAALPVAEIAAAARGERCCADAPPLPAVPPGRPLRIGHPRYFSELGRAAIAVRRALGERGGEVVALDPASWTERAREFDVVVTAMLVRPAGVAARYFGSGARNNAMGYAEAAYDAALARGDEQAAAEALRRNPPAVVLLRRERLVALDARIGDAELGDWGTFDRLPEWTVAP